jgi:hypothetical protein
MAIKMSLEFVYHAMLDTPQLDHQVWPHQQVCRASAS